MSYSLFRSGNLSKIAGWEEPEITSLPPDILNFTHIYRAVSLGRRTGADCIIFCTRNNGGPHRRGGHMVLATHRERDNTEERLHEGLMLSGAIEEKQWF